MIKEEKAGNTYLFSIPYIFHEDTHLSAVESGWVSNMMQVALNLALTIKEKERKL